ncbi:hypothetical protein [Streptomyces acidiscabies]|uniref:acyl-CoA-like ligand-binding transcription factor n=1 Tax=Streptomyces acidiscabies TaxID=42234 RepID=UPI00076E7A80|nr:hypothetical protein [Streptomyces acidiscabies]MBZ3917830.1 hypothetical protein [Streptomyces acidiscabies]GAQ50324.1 hypothetical protein a10_00101 [Streptomyces acidiscabies]
MRRSPSGTATGHSWAGGPMAACSVCDADPDRALHVSRLILDTPALLARFLERQSQWQAEMVGILARRTGLDPDVGMRPALAADVALTVYQTALRRWVDSDGTKPMDELADQAFAMITPALDLSTDPNRTRPRPGRCRPLCRGRAPPAAALCNSCMPALRREDIDNRRSRDGRTRSGRAHSGTCPPSCAASAPVRGSARVRGSDLTGHGRTVAGPGLGAGHRMGGWVRRPTSRCRWGARRR